MEVQILTKDNEPRGKAPPRLKLTLGSIDVSVVNALRRVITSNISTLVLRGFPHKENQINILKNTTKFNNEYLKHRLSCIPIANSDDATFTTFCNLYQLELKVTNPTLEQLVVTTADLMIINKKTQEQIEEKVDKYFPTDPITGHPIMICILYPNQNKQDEDETLHFIANFDIGCAEESSCWNVAHHCVFEQLQNEAKVKEESNKIEDKQLKKDFLLLEAQRIVYPNRFTLFLEGVGIYSNEALVYKACDYILKRLGQINSYFSENMNQAIQNKTDYQEFTSDGTLSQEEREQIKQNYCTLYKEDAFYIFELKEDDYTMGKMIESYFFTNYEALVSFVGFKKEHPTKKEAYIYIRYKNQETSHETIYQHLKSVVVILSNQFTRIQREFTSIN